MTEPTVPTLDINQRVDWQPTGDGEFPFEAQVGGERWRIRVNDWPEEPTVYSLMVGRRAAYHFDDWPAQWVRPAEA